MDIQRLVDRLEQVLNNSYRIPASAYLLINEDNVFGIVDQMRMAVPEEVKRANRIEGEKERILAQAHEEAQRIRDLAKQEAGELVKREVITSAAQQRADAILERARQDAELLRNDADHYVLDELTKLEEDLLRSLSVVRNGLVKLQSDQGAAQEQDEAAEAQSAPQ